MMTRFYILFCFILGTFCYSDTNVVLGSRKDLNKEMVKMVMNSKSLLVLDSALSDELKKSKFSVSIVKEDFNKLETRISNYFDRIIKNDIALGRAGAINTKREDLYKLFSLYFDCKGTIVLLDSKYGMNHYRSFLHRLSRQSKFKFVKPFTLDPAIRRSFEGLRKSHGEDFIPYSYNCEAEVINGSTFGTMSLSAKKNRVIDRNFEYIIKRWVICLAISTGDRRRGSLNKLENSFLKKFWVKVSKTYDVNNNKVVSPKNKTYFSDDEWVLFKRFKYDYENLEVFSNTKFSLKQKANKFEVTNASEYMSCMTILKNIQDLLYNDIPEETKLKLNITFRMERFISGRLFYDIYLCLNFKTEKDSSKYFKVMDGVKKNLYTSMKKNKYFSNPYLISPELLDTLDDGLLRSIYTYIALQFKVKEREIFDLKKEYIRRDSNKTDRILKCAQPESIGYGQFQHVLYEVKKYLATHGVETLDSTQEGYRGIDNYKKIIDQKQKEADNYGLNLSK